MQLLTTHLRRHSLTYAALAIFAVSLALPSVKVFGYESGYRLAFGTEQIAFELFKQYAEHAFRNGPPVEFQLDSSFAWSIPIGATANHAFFLSCLAVCFSRPRLATAFAAVAVLCAVGCLLPGQLANLHGGWILGPGYFLWCAAHAVLLAGTIRQWRRMAAGSNVPRDPPGPPLQRGGERRVHQAFCADAPSTTLAQEQMAASGIRHRASHGASALKALDAPYACELPWHALSATRIIDN